MPTLQFKGKNIIGNHHLAVPFHSEKDDIILFSFSGSGTTMHAVMELDKEDGENLEADDKISEADFYVGEHGKHAIYLVYKQNYETLTRLALNLTHAEKIKEQQPGKKRIVYAPSCFLDEEYLIDNQIEYVGIPYSLFSRG